MQDLDFHFFQQRPAVLQRVEDKGVVITAEGFLVVVSVYKIVRVLVEHGKNHHVVGDKGQKNLAARLADPLCFRNAPEPVRLAVQMVKGPKQQHNVKGIIPEST